MLALESEVLALYRGCKNPLEQIKIIAQCTEKKQAEIINILASYGIQTPPQKTRKSGASVHHETALKLYNSGLYDKEIAQALNVGRSTVHCWRKRNNLISNFKQNENQFRENY
jgi:DNA-binding NarL/FixJ family response regulator